MFKKAKPKNKIKERGKKFVSFIIALAMCFTMIVPSGVTVIAAQPDDTHTVTLAQNDGGTVLFDDREGDTASFGEGDKVNLSIAPDDGYQAADIVLTYDEDGEIAATDDATGKDAYSFEMPDEDITVSVSFEADGSETVTEEVNSNLFPSEGIATLSTDIMPLTASMVHKTLKDGTDPYPNEFSYYRFISWPENSGYANFSYEIGNSNIAETDNWKDWSGATMEAIGFSIPLESLSAYTIEGNNGNDFVYKFTQKEMGTIGDRAFNCTYVLEKIYVDNYAGDDYATYYTNGKKDGTFSVGDPINIGGLGTGTHLGQVSFYSDYAAGLTFVWHTEMTWTDDPNGGSIDKSFEIIASDIDKGNPNDTPEYDSDGYPIYHGHPYFIESWTFDDRVYADSSDEQNGYYIYDTNQLGIEYKTATSDGHTATQFNSWSSSIPRDGYETTQGSYAYTGLIAVSSKGYMSAECVTGGTCGMWLTFWSDSAVPDPEPDKTIRASTKKDTYNAGDEITFDVTMGMPVYMKTIFKPYTKLVFEDHLPDGLTYVSKSARMFIDGVDITDAYDDNGIKYGTMEDYDWVNKIVTWNFNSEWLAETSSYTGQKLQLKVQCTVDDGYYGMTVDNIGVVIYNDTETDISVPVPINPALQVQKESGNPSITDGNDCYSLEGATYGVYTSESNANSDSNRLTTLTTDENGLTETYQTNPGTYYVKELERSEGYYIDPNVYEVKLVMADDSAVDPVIVTSTSTEPVMNDPGGITLYKEDEETGNPVPQGNASLAGAQFTVEYYDGYYETESALPSSATRTWVIETKQNSAGEYVASFSDTYKVSGDDWYYNSDGVVTLPLGTYVIYESKAPEGYLISGTLTDENGVSKQADKKFISVLRDEDDAVWISGGNIYDDGEPVQRGDLDIAKWDNELVNFNSSHANLPQGDGTLEGATFEIVNDSTYSVVVPENGTEYAPGEVVMTITTEWDAMANQYIATTGRDKALPFGHYIVREIGAPVGYLNDGVIEREFDIEYDGEVVNYTGSDHSILNNSIRGGLIIAKWDKELVEYDSNHANVPQGDATLAGAVFEITNTSQYCVLVDSDGDGSYEHFEPGGVVMTITTEWDSSLQQYVARTGSRDLPYGSYHIEEVSAPTGYLNEGIIERDFTIRSDGEVVDMTASDDAIQNDVIRGGFELQKRDVQTLRDYPQGSATFEGATFTVTNMSERAVLVEGVLYEPGEVVKTVVTDENGYICTDDDLLPYGTYLIEETIAPEGYLLGNDTTHDKAIEQSVTEITFSVREDGKIYNLTGDTTENGESYIEPDETITDLVKRGDVSFVKQDGENQSTDMGSIPFRITSQTTGESHIIWTDANGDYSSDSTWNKHTYNTNAGTDEYDGLWFYGYDDAEDTGESTVGTEWRTEQVDDNLGALPYDIYDMDELPCEANEGYNLVHTSFIISRDIRTISLGTIDNYKYSIDTSATDATTGSHEVTGNTIHDLVLYANLTEGEDYTLVAKLYDTDTHEMVTDEDGEEVAFEHSITTHATTGTAEVSIDFDAEAVDGHTLVVYEYLYDENGDLLYAEEDPDNEEQTVNVMYNGPVPMITTSMVNNWTGEHQATVFENHNIDFTDTVSYSGLTPGKTYVVRGTLMDKETGEPMLDANDEEVHSDSEPFVAEEADGEVTVDFDFFAFGLHGTYAVAYEYLYEVNEDTSTEDISEEIADNEITFTASEDTDATEDADTSAEAEDIDTSEEAEDADTSVEDMNLTLVASHEDLDDEAQTVQMMKPTLWTYAIDTLTGEKQIDATDSVDITDMLDLTDLIIGHTYYVYGKAVDQEGNQIYDATTGEPVELYIEFVADAEEMELDIMRFQFDATGLDGQAIIFEEYLYADPDRTILITEEEDLGSAEETILFNGPNDEEAPLLTTELTDDLTGTHEALPSEYTSLTDAVSYEGVTPGETYTVKGTLMDKATGTPITDDSGNEVTATSETFTPEEASGTITNTFELDAFELGGTDVVAYEALYDADDLPVSIHEDIDDAAQTVSICDVVIGTTATETGTGNKTVEAGDVSITDTVTYDNVIAGMDYTMTGYAVDPGTGDAIVDSNNEVVTASKDLTPESANGEIDMIFQFDASELDGKTIVFVEYLYQGDELVGYHYNLSDAGQTMTIENPITTYTAPKTGVIGTIAAVIAAIAACAVIIVVRRRRIVR